MKKLVIFDLDGTLINSIGDLAQSTNYALQQCGYPTHATEEYNYFVGNGIAKLFERALPEEERTADNIAKMRECFLEHYAIHNADLTKPYDGVSELLSALVDKGLMLAVASNKYDEGTKKLVAQYFPNINFVEVLGQREGVDVKPDPAIVFDVLSKANVSPEDALFVGDSGVDMQTAINAGVDAVGVTWGFRPKEELQKFNPTHIINTPKEILNIVQYRTDPF